MDTRRVRPDSKGRIPLGSWAKDVSSFSLKRDGNKIILEPYTEIPASEKWLFDNDTALHSVKTGLFQIKTGKLQTKGSFAKYADDDIE